MRLRLTFRISDEHHRIQQGRRERQRQPKDNIRNIVLLHQQGRCHDQRRPDAEQDSQRPVHLHPVDRQDRG